MRRSVKGTSPAQRFGGAKRKGAKQTLNSLRLCELCVRQTYVYNAELQLRLFAVERKDIHRHLLRVFL